MNPAVTGGAIGRGSAPAAALGGRAAARWCTYRRATGAICLANLVAVLLVLRLLYTSPGSVVSARKRVNGKCSDEQIRRVEESIRIRRAAEPVELLEAVRKLQKVFAVDEKRRQKLPLELKQKVSYEILQKLRNLGETPTPLNNKEAINSWRTEKLKYIRSASAQNLSNLIFSSKETRMLKQALEYNWDMLREDIGLWIPVIVWHTENDDKPQNEPEEEEIIAGPPLPPVCNAELHSDYGGAAVRWGLTHHKESAADCCQACIDQAKRAKPGALRCNIWVYCSSEYGCYSPDKYEHKHQECWLKQADHPKVNFKDRYSELYRESHRTAPVVVPWMSGIISA